MKVSIKDLELLEKYTESERDKARNIYRVTCKYGLWQVSGSISNSRSVVEMALRNAKSCYDKGEYKIYDVINEKEV